MVLITLVIGAIAFFIAFMFTFKPASRIAALLISGIVLIGSIVLMVANYSNHFGMEKKTVTTSTEIYSASNSDTMPMMLYKKVGTSGKNNVYVYNLKSTQKTPNHTKADEYTSNKVKTTSDGTTATMQTKTTRWVWKSDFYKNLYMWSGMNNTIVKRVNTFTLPKTWVTLSTTQDAALKKEMASMTTEQQAASKTAGTQYVTQAVTAAMAKNPTMSTTEQGQIAKQAQAEYYSQVLKQAIASIK